MQALEVACVKVGIHLPLEFGEEGQSLARLNRYAAAGREWVQLWPLGEERRQIEWMATDVLPLLGDVDPAGPRG